MNNDVIFEHQCLTVIKSDIGVLLIKLSNVVKYAVICCQLRLYTSRIRNLPSKYAMIIDLAPHGMLYS